MGGAGGTAFLEPFLVDKWRVVLGDMRRANFLCDRRFLDLVGIMLLKYFVKLRILRAKFRVRIGMTGM